jgi:hypothetical protein
MAARADGGIAMGKDRAGGGGGGKLALGSHLHVHPLTRASLSEFWAAGFENSGLGLGALLCGFVR